MDYCIIYFCVDVTILVYHLISVIGPSGIGKSTALAKAVSLSGGGQILVTDRPYAQIIPCINVQCPHDCSVKGLLLAVLSQVDMAIGTSYSQSAARYRASVDVIIGMVSQVSLNNILLIVIDECQNICRNRNGASLAASMTQLINSSGVSICMVGLPETEQFFGKEMQLARRSVGLSYSALPYGEYFIRFCEILFSYQYVANVSELTPGMMELLYECSGGIIAVLVSLIMEAQQIAVLTGREELSRETILMAYRERHRNVQDFVHVDGRKRSQTSTAAVDKTLEVIKGQLPLEPDIGAASFSGLASLMRESGTDIAGLLAKNGILVEEVAV